MHTTSNALLFCQFLLWLCLAALVSPVIAETPPAEHPQTADDIIRHMKTLYAGSQTYRDLGVVKDVFLKPNGSHSMEKPFTTAFVRPDRFRYEFREAPPGQSERRFIIQQNGSRLRVHWDLKHDMQLPTLDRAIAAATGVSSESAITVPGMLLPKEITWRRAIRFNEPMRMQDEKLGDSDCFRIRDRFGRSIVTYWIDKESFLLRKMFKETAFDDFLVKSTTTYAPELNGDVDPKLLEFWQPGKKP